MSFTLQQFFGGGRTLSPSANAKLNWRLARFWRIDPTTGGLALTLADARNARAGMELKVYAGNANSFTVKDHAGTTLATFTLANLYRLMLRDNSTAAGVWLVEQL